MKRLFQGIENDVAGQLSPQPALPCEPGHGATGDIEALPLQLPPDLAHAIDPEVFLEDAADLDLQSNIAAGAD